VLLNIETMVTATVVPKRSDFWRQGDNSVGDLRSRGEFGDTSAELLALLSPLFDALWPALKQPLAHDTSGQAPQDPH
jgi:hypothetical protein